MNQIYFLCAVLGGTIFLGQFLLGLVGWGDHHDFSDHDLSGEGGLDHAMESGDVDHAGDECTDGNHELGHESAMSWFLGVLSVRTVVAAVTFFGLAGLAAEAQGAHPAGSLAVALVAGIAALYLVAWTMRSLSRLRADGTARIHSALGQTGVVYLTIPGSRTGRGKVTVTIQNRTMEYEALTDRAELPTGAAVRVVAIVDPETLAVEPVSAESPPNPTPELMRTSNA